MKRALWAIPVLVAFMASAWLAKGSYSYYYSQTLYPANWSNWIIYNGMYATCQSQGYCGAWGVGGSTALYGGQYGPGATGEVRLTIRRDVNNPPYLDDYLVYFGSSGDPLQWNATYYEFIMGCQSPYGSVAFLKRTPDAQGNYHTTQLASSSASCNDPSVFRAVLNDVPEGRTAIAYVGDTRIFKYTWNPSWDENSISGGAGFGIDAWNGIGDGVVVSSVDLGMPDHVAPNPVPSGSIGKSSYINHVDLSWPATTDDANGTGVYNYEIWRNGAFLGSTTGLTFSDTTVNPSTTYSYTLKAFDYHGWHADTTFNVTTPYIQTNGPFPSVTPDGRRVGVRSTGAYWGASGENIDVMSGNLNFTLPLVKAQARSGWGVGFNLNYNSQNWRYDTGGNWNFGGDVGYGFGWQLLAGSITPVYSDPWTVSYYLFTDATGAEYRLDQNSGGIWGSKESIYVYYDPNAMVLHFRDGSYWYFGCISAASEADSGVMYPTSMLDTNGNWVSIGYQTSPGATWTNSSARITQIEDTRGKGSSTYTFTYNNDTPVRHLTAISNSIGTGENYSFTYLTGQALYSPFNSQSFGTTAMMRRVTVNANSTYHEFTYNGSGELTQILLPYKGYLAYDYTTANYPNSTSYREVVRRYLSKDGTSQAQYTFSHEPSPSANTHQYTILDDPGGVGEKYWTFATSGLAQGLVTQYQGRQLPGPVAKIQNDYTWVQDAVSNSYISSVTTTADPGQSYAAAKKTDQTVDTHGNVTQVKTYEYGNLSTPVRTDNYSYLTGSGYTSLYIFNRLTSSPTTTITYDECCLSSPPADAHEWSSPGTNYRGNPTTIVSPAGTQSLRYDFAGGVRQNIVNGLSSSITTNNTTNYTVPSQVTVGSLSDSLSYNSFLGLTNETGPNGASTTLGYDTMARPSSSTSPFGATTTTSYNDTASPPTVQANINGRWTRTTMDGLGRTIKVETGYGGTTVSVAETEYDSCGCSPLGKMKRTALAHAPGANPVWTTYTYDGIGRTLSSTTAGTETTSTTNYVYQGNTVTVTDAAGKWKKYTMNALGQLVQVNEPNPAGGSDYVTTYAYDTLGHLTSVNMPRPSGTQTRTFNYGNPPGNQLLSATNPENGTVYYGYNSDKTLATKTDAKNQQVQYSYDSYKRVTQVRRTFWGISSNTVVINARRWGSGLTVGNTLGSTFPDLAVLSGYDGGAQDFTFTTTDNLGQANLRLLYVNTPSVWVQVYSLTLNGQRYYPEMPPPWPGNCDSYGNCYMDFYTAPAGTPTPGYQEDTCQREDYYYDSNPFDGTFSQNAQGRLTAVQYKGGNNTGATPACDTTFTEMYSYNSAGARVKKRLRVSRSTGSFDLDATYTYDNEGRITATQYPSSWNGSSWVAGPNLGSTYDSMGRPQKLTDLGSQQDIESNATYGPMGQLLTLSGAVSETRTYNSIGQMTQLQSGSLNILYNYSASQNNGKIISQQDVVSGEQITYTYDSLNRLASATGSGWGQSYNYDGFGNLTDQNVTSGTAPTLHVAYNAATNRQMGDCADANGNLNSATNCSGGYAYDVENRITAQVVCCYSPIHVGFAYSYGPGNKRVWRGAFNYQYDGSSWTITPTTDEVTFWGVNGQKLATYQVSISGSSLVATQTGTDYYFGGKLIKNATGYVTPDRLGSIGKYFPYGQERPSATQDGTDKFATYFRDSETGLDYADQRYHQPGMGRFMSPDPYGSGSSPQAPGSWNKYSYTGGDPVNRIDPRGNTWTCIDQNGDVDCFDDGYDGSISEWCSMMAPYAWVNPVGYEMMCGGGGGGGGGGAGQPIVSTFGGGSGPVKVSNYSDSGPKVFWVESMLTKIKGALDALPSDNQCVRWLQSGGVGIDELIGGLLENHTYGTGDFSDNKVAAFVGSRNADGTSAGVPVTAALTVNNNGAFFDSAYTADGYGGGSTRAQAAILIHELAHLFGAAGFDPNDATDEKAGKRNDALMNKNCGNVIKGIK